MMENTTLFIAMLAISTLLLCYAPSVLSLESSNITEPGDVIEHNDVIGHRSAPHLNLYPCPDASAGCQNGGKLVTRNGSVATACECDNFHEGICCETKRCIMGGKLVNNLADGQMTCDCPAGHQGDHCERVSCGAGELVYANATHFCNCPIMYQGKYCEHKRCINGGVLTQSNTCKCPERFSGKYCQFISCARSGEPQPSVFDPEYANYQYFCYCYALYAGRFCEGYNVGVICVLIFTLVLVVIIMMTSLLSYSKKRKTGHYRVGRGAGQNVFQANAEVHENDKLLVPEPQIYGNKGVADLRGSQERSLNEPQTIITTNPSYRD